MATASERKAKEREAKRAAGFVRVEAWVPVERVDFVRMAIAVAASKEATDP